MSPKNENVLVNIGAIVLLLLPCIVVYWIYSSIFQVADKEEVEYYKKVALEVYEKPYSISDNGKIFVESGEHEQQVEKWPGVSFSRKGTTLIVSRREFFEPVFEIKVSEKEGKVICKSTSFTIVTVLEIFVSLLGGILFWMINHHFYRMRHPL